MREAQNRCDGIVPDLLRKRLCVEEVLTEEQDVDRGKFQRKGDDSVPRYSRVEGKYHASRIRTVTNEKETLGDGELICLRSAECKPTKSLSIEEMLNAPN